MSHWPILYFPAISYCCNKLHSPIYIGFYLGFNAGGDGLVPPPSSSMSDYILWNTWLINYNIVKMTIPQSLSVNRWDAVHNTYFLKLVISELLTYNVQQSQMYVSSGIRSLIHSPLVNGVDWVPPMPYHKSVDHE